MSRKRVRIKDLAGSEAFFTQMLPTEEKSEDIISISDDQEQKENTETIDQKEKEIEEFIEKFEKLQKSQEFEEFDRNNASPMKVRCTFYFTPEQLKDLEETRLQLLLEYGIKTDKSNIVRIALSELLNDFKNNGENSLLVGILQGKI